MKSPKTMRSFRLAALCAAIVLTLLPATLYAGPITVVHSLTDGGGDGSLSRGQLALVGSSIYGIAQTGGSHSDGTIFSVNTTTNVYATTYNFADSGTDGSFPVGGLAGGGPTLYGTTAAGGASNLGTIFSYNTTNNAEGPLHSFTGSPSDGNGPVGDILVGTLLYGTTNTGGANNKGTIYSFDTSNNTTTILHSFTGADGNGSLGGLTIVGSTLYGTTTSGGTNNDGTLFSFNTSNNTFADLHNFNGSDGQNGIGDLALIGTKLYGVTQLGGAHANGSIFGWNTANNTFASLYSFSGFDGSQPAAGLTPVGSMLYGTAMNGGANNKGTIFSFNPVGSLNTLASFSGTDGSTPRGELLQVGNSFYGTTYIGGSANDGTVFTIGAPEPASSTLAIVAGCCLALGAIRARNRRRRATL